MTQSLFQGIILLPGFLDEFFPEESRGPDTFRLLHYNGLVRSEASHAAYVKGELRELDIEGWISSTRRLHNYKASRGVLFQAKPLSLRVWPAWQKITLSFRHCKQSGKTYPWIGMAGLNLP